MNHKKELGKQIKEFRESKGIRHSDLLKKGIHPTTQTRIESGDKGYTIDLLTNYCNAFGMPYKLDITFKVEDDLKILIE